MGNRPEYLAIWLGITSVGGVVSLLNTNLLGPSLAHCINVVSPTHLIVAAEYSVSWPRRCQGCRWLRDLDSRREHEYFRQIDLEVGANPERC